jgi:hypothetical protein
VQSAKGLGVDYIYVSSIGNGRGAIPFELLFQVPLAETIKLKSESFTRAVSSIATAFEAENKAEMSALG